MPKPIQGERVKMSKADIKLDGVGPVDNRPSTPCCQPKVLGDQLTAVQFCVASTDQGSSSSLPWPLAGNGLPL